MRRWVNVVVICLACVILAACDAGLEDGRIALLLLSNQIG